VEARVKPVALLNWKEIHESWFPKDHSSRQYGQRFQSLLATVSGLSDFIFDIAQQLTVSRDNEYILSSYRWAASYDKPAGSMC